MLAAPKNWGTWASCFSTGFTSFPVGVSRVFLRVELTVETSRVNSMY